MKIVRLPLKHGTCEGKGGRTICGMYAKCGGQLHKWYKVAHSLMMCRQGCVQTTVLSVAILLPPSLSCAAPFAGLFSPKGCVTGALDVHEQRKTNLTLVAMVAVTTAVTTTQPAVIKSFGL